MLPTGTAGRDGGADDDGIDDDGIEVESSSSCSSCSSDADLDYEMAKELASLLPVMDGRCPGMTLEVLQTLEDHDHPDEYDTLKQLDLHGNISSVHDLETLLLSVMYPSPDGTNDGAYGIVWQGTFDLRSPENLAGWGKAARFGSEAYFVRSWPPRRIGKRLMPGETRFVDVLVVDAPDESPGAVTGELFKAVLTSVPEPRRSPWSRALMHTIPNLNEDRLCAAALGVPLLGVNLITEHKGHQRGHACDGYTLLGASRHGLIPGFYTSQELSVERYQKHTRTYAKLYLDTPLPIPGKHRYVLAAALMNLPLTIANISVQTHMMVEQRRSEEWAALDDCSRRAFAEALEAQQCATSAHAATIDGCSDAVKSVIASKLPALRMTASGATGGRLSDADLHTVVEHNLRLADHISEMAGPVAVLDLLAHPFHEGALPDELQKPCGVPLLLVLATRVAAYPTRYHVGCEQRYRNDKLADDGVAAARLAAVLESALGAPLVPKHEVYDAPFWAIDAVGETMSDRIQTQIQSSAQEQDSEERRRAARLGFSERYVSNMLGLHRIGCAIALDLACAVPYTEAIAAQSTPYGQVTGDWSALDRAEAHAFHAAGLGIMGDEANGPSRTTDRAQRLAAFVRCAREVEEWIQTGRWRGSPCAIDARYLSPASERDNEEAAPTTATATATLTPNAPSAAAPAAADASEPAAGGGGGGGKKKRGAKRKDAAAAPPKPVDSVDVTVRTAHINVRNELWVDRPCKPVADRTHADSRIAASKLLSEAALLTAARQWQPGPLAAFVQAPTALTNCCSCYLGKVRPLSTLLLGGRVHSRCSKCHAPRCLGCVQQRKEMETRALRRGEALSQPPDDNCRYCAQTAAAAR